MQVFDDPRSCPDTELELPIIIIDKSESVQKSQPISTVIMITILLVIIVGLFLLIILTGGAIIGV